MLIALCYGAGAAFVFVLVMTIPRLFSDYQKPYVPSRRDYFAAQLLRNLNPHDNTDDQIENCFRTADRVIKIDEAHRSSERHYQALRRGAIRRKLFHR